MGNTRRIFAQFSQAERVAGLIAERYKN